MTANDLRQRASETLTAFMSEIPLARIESIAPDSDKLGQTPDLVFRLVLPEHEQILVVEVKESGQPKRVREGINQLQRYLRSLPGAYGILMAPYIASKSAAICEAEGIGYADLAGNCRLAFQNVYIRREGRPNPFAEKRELRSLYSPKASRVLRVLLVNAGRSKGWKVVDLAKEAKVSLGQVSNVKRRLEEREWIGAGPEGVVLTEPEALLREWAENYSFRRNLSRDFYSPKGIGEIERELSEACRELKVRCALTGFSAAARLAPAVRHSRAMAYVEGNLDGVAARLDLKPVDSGPNVMLLGPHDEGVFYGWSEPPDSPAIVSAVQAYLDLKGFRGRGEEAAEALLKHAIQLTWPTRKAITPKTS